MFRYTILAAAVVAAANVVPAAARPAKAPGCEAGRFLVTEGRERLGGGDAPVVLSLQGRTLTVEGACPATGKARATRKGTRLSAKWQSCGELRKLRLRATAPDCASVLAGTLRARKHPKAAFAAEPLPRLACEEAGVPCRFSEVPLAVAERSLALSEEALARLEGGAAPDEVGTFLAAEPDVAEVTVDGALIGFRVAGGRPMLVDFAGEQEILSSGEAESAPVGEALRPASPLAAPPGSGAPRAPRVVGGDGPEKRALVLSPFRYEPGFGNAGEQVAERLLGVRGYESGVSYLATLDELAPQVTVDTLAELGEYDVVHVDTHGGTLCKKYAAETAEGEEKPACEDGVTDFLVQRFHGTAEDLRSLDHPGVVHYRGRLHESIAVTPDFFRYHYPAGLSNTLFVLGSCNTFRPDLADAIAGGEGIYVSWDRFVDFALVRETSLALFDLLASGITVGEAFALLPPFDPQHPGAEGSRLRRSERKAGGDLRIRELPRLIDPFTGDTLVSGSLLEIAGNAGDGEPDRLRLQLEVEGIHESEPFRVLEVTVDGATVAAGPLGGFAEPVGPYAWEGETEIDLGFDVQDGQAIELVARVVLPEGGTSEFAVSPRLEGPGFDAGQRWQGTFHFWDEGLTLETMTVTAIFERVPDDGPEERYPRFELVSGSLTWSLSDLPGDCIYTAPTTESVLAADENDFFELDLGDRPVTYYGNGRSVGPLVDLVRDCPDLPTGPVTSSTEAGGQWFQAPIEEGFVALSDEVIGGEFSWGFGSPHLWTWTLTKLE